MILKYLSLFIRKSGAALIRLSQLVFREKPDASQILLQKWFEDEGDRTLRLNYQLGPKSVVFDLGGYEGQWTSDLYSKFQCSIYIFELNGDYAENMKQRFSKNTQIRVFPFGLSGADHAGVLYLNENRSSLYKESDLKKDVQFKEISRFMREQEIENIDLIKLNIEGGEYDLLDHVLDIGLQTHFKNIQVQFHDFVPHAASRMEKIQTRLAKTHELTYQYPYIWENWKLKTNKSTQAFNT